MKRGKKKEDRGVYRSAGERGNPLEKDNRILPAGCLFFLGAGRVGYTLIHNFAQRGAKVGGIWNRTKSRVKTLISDGRFPIFFGDEMPHPKGSDTVFICVSDRAIPETTKRLASGERDLEGVTIFHTSGALTSSVLEPLKQKGAVCGSFHPLMAITINPPHFNSLRGSFITIEGDGSAVEKGMKLAELLNATPLLIPSDMKTLYHVGALFSSNFLHALIGTSLKLMERTGMEKETAFRAIIRLAKSTIDNIEKMGIRSSLTGPLSRGDTETIALHIEELKKEFPSILPAYLQMNDLLLEWVEDRATLLEKLSSLKGEK